MAEKAALKDCNWRPPSVGVWRIVYATIVKHLLHSKTQVGRLVSECRYLELKVERGIHSDSGWMYDPSKWFKFEAVVDKIQATCLRQVLNRREMVRASVLKSYQR